MPSATAAYLRISFNLVMSEDSSLKISLTFCSSSAPSAALMSRVAFFRFGQECRIFHRVHERSPQDLNAVLWRPRRNHVRTHRWTVDPLYGLDELLGFFGLRQVNGQGHFSELGMGLARNLQYYGQVTAL